MKAADIINDAHAEIIGLDARLRVFGGHDKTYYPAHIGHDARDWGEVPDESNTMIPTEKVLLADHMLARWQAYKQAALAECQLTPPSPPPPA